MNFQVLILMGWLFTLGVVLLTTNGSNPAGEIVTPVTTSNINYTGFGYSSGISEKMTTCSEFFDKYKVEPTERNWFLCMNALGGAL